MELIYIFLAVFILPYVIALVSAGKYSWRWNCAAALLLLNGMLAVFLSILLIGIAGWSGGLPEDFSLLQFFSPTGYLMLLALAAVMKTVRMTSWLIVTAHVVLLAGLQFWGSESRPLTMVCIFTALFTPICLLMLRAKLRHLSSPPIN